MLLRTKQEGLRGLISGMVYDCYLVCEPTDYKFGNVLKRENIPYWFMDFAEKGNTKLAFYKVKKKYSEKLLELDQEFPKSVMLCSRYYNEYEAEALALKETEEKFLRGEVA